MRYLLLDYNTDPSVYDNIGELRTILSERASEQDYYFDRWIDNVSIYEVGPKVPLKIERQEVAITIGSIEDIPPANPGETKADYVKRLIG